MPAFHDASLIKRFFRDAATYAVSGVATTFVGVVMVPIYTRVFTPSEYGALDLIATVLAFLILVLAMGQQSAVGRFYVDSEGDRDRRLSAATSGLFLAILSASVAAAVLGFHKSFARLLLGSTGYSTAMAAAIASVPFTVLFRFLQNMLKWRQEPVKYLGISISSMVFGLGLTIYLVVVAGKGVTGVYLATLINAVVFSCVALALARSSFAFAFSFSRLSELLKFGCPLIPVAVAYYLITYSDRYCLRYFEGLDTVGLYAISVRVSSVLALLLNGFQMAIGPFVYSYYKEEHAPQTFSKTFDYVSVAVTLGVTGLALLAADIVKIFATATYLPAHVAVPFLATGTAAYGLGAYFSFGIGIAKKTMHRAWASALAAGLNVGLNLLLVPRFGMVGAAAATCCSFFVLAGVQMIISQRLYRVPYRFRRNLAMYVTAAGVILIAYSTGIDRPGFGLIPLKVALLACVLGVAAAVGLVSRSEFEYIKGLTKKLSPRRKP
jgi:O-antigen/teichoic acid export membrane protein